MGYQTTKALAQMYQPVPSYEELIRENWADPKKVAPGIKREYTRFVLSPYYDREFAAAFAGQMGYSR